MHHITGKYWFLLHFPQESDEKNGAVLTNQPLVVVAAKDLIKDILHYNGKEWSNQLNKNAPWFWWRLFQKFSNIITKLMVYAIDPDAVNNTANKIFPKSDHRALQDILVGFSNLKDDIRRARESGDTGQIFSDNPPALWCSICN
jgi:hypothetical protein